MVQDAHCTAACSFRRTTQLHDATKLMPRKTDRGQPITHGKRTPSVLNTVDMQESRLSPSIFPLFSLPDRSGTVLQEIFPQSMTPPSHTTARNDTAHRRVLSTMGVVLKISTTREEHYAGSTLEGCVKMEVVSVSPLTQQVKSAVHFLLPRTPPSTGRRGAVSSFRPIHRRLIRLILFYRHQMIEWKQ